MILACWFSSGLPEITEKHLIRSLQMSCSTSIKGSYTPPPHTHPHPFRFLTWGLQMVKETTWYWLAVSWLCTQPNMSRRGKPSQSSGWTLNLNFERVYVKCLGLIGFKVSLSSLLFTNSGTDRCRVASETCFEWDIAISALAMLKNQ